MFVLDRQVLNEDVCIGLPNLGSVLHSCGQGVVEFDAVRVFRFGQLVNSLDYRGGQRGVDLFAHGIFEVDLPHWLGRLLQVGEVADGFGDLGGAFAHALLAGFARPDVAQRERGSLTSNLGRAAREPTA